LALYTLTSNHPITLFVVDIPEFRPLAKNKSVVSDKKPFASDGFADYHFGVSDHFRCQLNNGQKNKELSPCEKGSAKQ
jgi:hypothetical protein